MFKGQEHQKANPIPRGTYLYNPCKGVIPLSPPRPQDSSRHFGRSDPDPEGHYEFVMA